MQTYYVSEIGNNFHPTPSPLPPQKNKQALPKIPGEDMSEEMQRHQTIWRQIKYNIILLSKNKTNRIIASYRRYYCSFHLLLPLVFTVTDL